MPRVQIQSISYFFDLNRDKTDIEDFGISFVAGDGVEYDMSLNDASLNQLNATGLELSSVVESIRTIGFEETFSESEIVSLPEGSSEMDDGIKEILDAAEKDD